MAVGVSLAVSACGSAAPVAGPPAAPVAGPPSVQAQPDAGATAADGCPLTAEALSDATSLSWELQDTREDYPLETVDGVTATVCLFTAPDSPQAGGDPLVLRVDVVTGADAATVRTGFEESCTGNSGTVSDSPAAAGAKVCERDGAVVEGDIATGERTVEVYLVNADTATAETLTPTFEKVLAAIE